METKNIAIIVLAMLVVLLIGFVLGQRRRGSTNSTPNTSSQSSLSTTEMTATARVEVLPSKPRPRDYSRQISKTKIFHERVAAVYADIANIMIRNVFNDQFGKINQAYERFNTDKEEHSREELLTLFSSMFDAAKFGNVQKDINTVGNDIAKEIVEYYDDQVSAIFSDQSFASISSRYALNADLRASQLAQISAIIVSHFSSVISEMKDIEQRRIFLQSNYQAFLNATNDEIDWESAARSFGAGALAVVNPIIGIPTLIAHFSSQSGKDKAKSAQIDSYLELLVEFENQVLAVRKNIIQSAELTKIYVYEKFKEVNSLAITTLLSEIATNGCVLEHYFKKLDYKWLENTERKLQGA